MEALVGAHPYFYFTRTRKTFRLRFKLSVSRPLLPQRFDLVCYAIKEVEDVDLLTFFDSLGDHGERKNDYRRSGQTYRGVPAISVLHDHPFHAQFLNKCVAQHDTHALQLVGLTWLERTSFNERS